VERSLKTINTSNTVRKRDKKKTILNLVSFSERMLKKNINRVFNNTEFDLRNKSTIILAQVAVIAS
jgi:hypothetical protein